VKVLVTGDSGFVGRHLRQELEAQSHQVNGLSLSSIDIRNFEELRNFLDVTRPQQIYHLAAQAYVPESFANPVRVFEVNTIGSLNLLEAVRQLGLKTRILLAGTSEEYGDAEPLEAGYVNPLSPYAIAKLAMDKRGLLYAKTYGMNVVVTRAFNHTGPGRGEMYAESSFAKQIAEIEKGQRDFLEHGNLETIRNYIDVRDVVRAYRLAIELPSDVYNICSDQNVTMQEIIEMLIKNSLLDIQTRINPALYRPADFSFKNPSCKKLSRLTNWKPQYKLEQTLEDLLNYWRNYEDS
jgi:GDP-4-dehydro-6-deoxy-D-mannose reductase